MKQFHWRLQRILEIKQKQEQAKRTELMAVSEKLNQAQMELEDQQQIVQELIDDLLDKKPQERLAEQSFYLARLSANDKIIHKLQEEIENLEQQRKDITDETIKLIQFNEGLERLRSRTRDEFIKDQESQEQKELDNISAFRFAGKEKQMA